MTSLSPSVRTRRFHELWLGMAQPSEGLVVSLPVLVDAQCAEKHPREAHLAFIACLEEDAEGRLRAGDLAGLFADVLDLGADRFDAGEALPRDLSLYVVEGKQLLRPTRTLKWNKPREDTISAAAAPAPTKAKRPRAPKPAAEDTPKARRKSRKTGGDGQGKLGL